MSRANGHDEKGLWSSLFCCFPPVSSSNKQLDEKHAPQPEPIRTRNQPKVKSWEDEKATDEKALMHKSSAKVANRTVIYEEPQHHPKPMTIPEKSPVPREVTRRIVIQHEPPKEPPTWPPVVQEKPKKVMLLQAAPKKAPKRSKSASAKSTPQRPVISAPTHFRHITTGSPSSQPAFVNAVDIPPTFRERRPSCPQLHLNLSSPDLQLTLKEKRRGLRCESLPPPPRIWGQSQRDSVGTLPSSPTSSMHSGLGHRRWMSTSSLLDLNKPLNGEFERSFSSMSFHFPRKPATENGIDSQSSIGGDDCPSPLPVNARRRPRAFTAPKMEAPNEEVATMIKIGQLQKPSISNINRRSLCVDTQIECPRTPASKSFARNQFQYDDFDPATLQPPPYASHGRSGSRIPLPPPLPPMLRQQTKKRKSLSQVSHWLFSETHDGPVDSSTNLPSTLTVKDILHEYAMLASLHSRRHSRRHSYGSINTATTGNTDDHRGSLSSWSLNSSAVTTGNEYYIPRTWAARRNRMSSPLATVGVAV